MTSAKIFHCISTSRTEWSQLHAARPESCAVIYLIYSTCTATNIIHCSKRVGGAQHHVPNMSIE